MHGCRASPFPGMKQYSPLRMPSSPRQEFLNCKNREIELNPSKQTSKTEMHSFCRLFTAVVMWPAAEAPAVVTSLRSLESWNKPILLDVPCQGVYHCNGPETGMSNQSFLQLCANAKCLCQTKIPTVVRMHRNNMIRQKHVGRWTEIA